MNPVRLLCVCVCVFIFNVCFFFFWLALGWNHKILSACSNLDLARKSELPRDASRRFVIIEPKNS